MIRPLYCAGWSCTSTATYSQSFFAFFPCQHSVFSLSAHVLSFQSWPCLLIKLAKEEKNAHWHLLIKKHNRNGCFKFRPIKSQQKHCHTSTWKDKPNLTLARCGISNQCCCTKKISDKILIWLWKTHTVKQHWYWKSHSGKQKHTLLHRNKVEACFSHSKEAGFYLFLDFQIIFGWDVLLGMLFACFVMTWIPAERWMAVLVFIFWEKCVKKVC